MKRAQVTRFVVATLVALLLLMPVMGACSRPAPAPAPAPKTAPAPAPAPKSAPAPAPAPKANPLAAIIEGAKKERVVSMLLTSGYDAPNVVETLRKAVNDKYGVDLDIKVQVTASMAASIAKGVMETQAGAEPSYDVVVFSTDYIPRVTREGIFETVDWRSLLEPGTPREVQYEHPQLKAGIVIYGGTLGFMYNPDKIPAAQAPKKLADLADPKWKGKLGVLDVANHWARYAFMLGKDKTLASIRSILKTNRPILDQFAPLNTRYLAGEIDLVYTVIDYIAANRGRGKATAWSNMELVEIRDYQLVVMKGTKRPNAAKLVSVFLASPDGAKFTIEVVKRPHHLFGGNAFYDAVTSAKKEGIPIYTWESFPGLLDFISSPAYEGLQKEIQLIFDTEK